MVQKAKGKLWAHVEARAVMDNWRFVQFFDTVAFF